MFTKEILSNQNPEVPHCHCPTIALAPSGDVLAGWYAYPQKETTGGMLMLARKRTGGSRFDLPVRILADMSRSLGNPVLFFDINGRLHLLFVVLNGTYWDSAIALGSYSDDLGATWSRPESLRLPEGMMIRYPPVAMRHAGLLLPAYDERTNQTVLVSGGLDGRGWREVTRFDDRGAIQGSIVRQSQSDLTMLLRPCGEIRCCLRAISGDDGRCWSPVIRTPLPNPLSGVVAFQLGDLLCAVYNHTTEHRRYPLSLSHSADRGTTWTGPVHIDETEHEVSYPAFVVDDRDVVHGVYTFGRSRIQYVTFDRAWILDSP